MNNDPDFVRLIQAAQEADASWARAHGVKPIGPSDLAVQRLSNIIQAVVWESRIIKQRQEIVEDVLPQKTVREKILLTLKGQALDKKELKTQIGRCSQKGLQIVLWQLLSEGSVVIDTYGRYSLTSNKNRSTLRV